MQCTYHLSCLVKLYRQAASIECAENDENDQSRFLKAQAFADLVDYLESQRGTGSVFQTAEIVNLYITAPVPILGVNEYVHTTRLRQQVIAAVPDLVEVKCPSNRTELAFDDDISQALQELADSCDTEAMALVKVAKILRQHMLSMKYNFTGSFSPSKVSAISTSVLPRDVAQWSWHHEAEMSPSSSSSKNLSSSTVHLAVDNVQLREATIIKSWNHITTYPFSFSLSNGAIGFELE